MYGTDVLNTCSGAISCVAVRGYTASDMVPGMKLSLKLEVVL